MHLPLAEKQNISQTIHLHFLEQRYGLTLHVMLLQEAFHTVGMRWVLPHKLRFNRHCPPCLELKQVLHVNLIESWLHMDRSLTEFLSAVNSHS